MCFVSEKQRPQKIKCTVLHLDKVVKSVKIPSEITLLRSWLPFFTTCSVRYIPEAILDQDVNVNMKILTVF